MIKGILFDLGHTLVNWPPGAALEKLRGTYAENRAYLVGLGIEGVPSVEELLEGVARRMDRELEASYVQGETSERDFNADYRRCLKDMGLDLPGDVLEELVRREHRAYAVASILPPDTLALLEVLKARGYPLGLVSNTNLLPQLFISQPPLNLLPPFFDAMAFSSQVGLRKPHPHIYHQALDGMGLSPQDILFVGDRIREDIGGPKSLGMRALLCHRFRQEEDREGLADGVIEELPQVLAFLDGGASLRPPIMTQ